MEPLAYYAAQSLFTDPGTLSHLFADLPADIPTLRHIAGGLVVHYRAGDLQALGIPDERVPEINTRYADAMLQRIVELDDRPLAEERPKQQRLVGCCRDFTVLFLAMLRHKGIPARARVGFASYFVPGWFLDHEIAEVWDASEGCWRLIDAELADIHIDPADSEPLDALNLPRDRFLVAGTAWQQCRAGLADPERFIVDPGLDIPQTRGWLQIRHNLVQDLAALNQSEMLLWDTWGLLEGDMLSAPEAATLDRIAEATCGDDPSLSVLQGHYRDGPGLQVPGVITSFNMMAQQPMRVSLER